MTTHPGRVTATALVLACGLAAGCGSRPGREPATGSGPALAAAPTRAAAAAAPAPLTATATGPAGAGWVVVPMGGPAAQEDQFWELFTRPSAAAHWRLATPAGVADNGGLAVTGTSAALVTGFRPSQDLTFSPLAVTTDDGATWSPAGPVSPGLAGGPGSLAAGPDGALVALTSGGRAVQGSPSGAGWTTLTSAGQLGATRAGAACAPSSLTAAAFSGSGAPVLATSCRRPGVVGIFTRTGSGWTGTGPVVPPALAGADFGVLRLAAAGSGLVALLRAVSAAGTSLVAAWPAGPGRWRWSAPLRTGTRALRSTAVGPGGALAVLLSGGRADVLAGPGARWQALPPAPAPAAALTIGPGGRLDAITADGDRFADWQLVAGWRRVQTLTVAIPYGSSG
ncbi:MAG: hypothetical protein JO016_09455 [Actinobacteria bacterium]|nr:hypothetical protein [Actinomycetota bacterium]